MIGLVLGYLSIALTFVAIAFFAIYLPSRGGPDVAATSPSAETPRGRLNEAELMVMGGGTEHIGFGNSPTAQTIAARFADKMKEIDDVLFTSNRKPLLEISGGEFLTFCELHDSSCAFIVHVPSYRHYDREAKKALAELAWTAALSELQNSLEPGEDVAVALRGAISYGDIMIGHYSADESKGDERRLGSTKDLLPFFELDEFIPASQSAPSRAPVENRLNSSRSENDLAQPNESSWPDVPSPASNVDSKVADPFGAPVPTAPKAEPIPDKLGPSTTPSNAPAEVGSSQPSRVPRPRPTKTEFKNVIPVALTQTIDAAGWNIQSLLFLRDKSRLVAGRLDSTITIFDTTNGKTIFQSERMNELDQIVSLACSHDEQYLFVGGYSGAVSMFEIGADERIGHAKPLFKHAKETGCIVVSPHHSFLLTGGRDGTVAWQPFDARSNSVRTIQKLKRPVQSIFLELQARDVLATDGQTLIKFSLSSGELLDEWKLGAGSPRASAFSPKGDLIAVSYGSELKTFSTATGAFQNSYSGRDSGTIWSTLFHPVRPWLITGGNGQVTIWDVESADRLAVLDVGSPLHVKTLIISADGKCLAVVPAAAGQSIRIFDVTP